MLQKIKAKSILTKQKKIDSWFLSGYTMNIYRGCSHQCSYCDGRAEQYRVGGDFGSDIVAKINAPELLVQALNPKRKRTAFQNGFIMIGGGVGDAYQPIEAELELTKQTLEVLVQHGRPAHLLTKNCLIERDLNLIADLHSRSQAIVSMSFSSIDDDLSQRLEPGASLPSDRLKTLKRFKQAGIPTGMMLMPVIPFITDQPDRILAAIQAGKSAEVDFILFGTMTLKAGQQKEHFMHVLDRHFPSVNEFYHQIYQDDPWGNTIFDYHQTVSAHFAKAVKTVGLARRIPLALYDQLLTENEKISILLDQLDYCLKQDGKPSPYGYAAYQVRKSQVPLSTISTLQSINGIGPFTEKLIKEIISHGHSAYIDKMIQSP